MTYKSAMTSPSPKMARLVARLVLAGLLLAAVTVAALTYYPALAQSQPGAVDNLQLNSNSPGELRATWDTPSPAPSDYRIRWAPVSQNYLSWRDTNEALRGNSYPDGDTTSLTLTGLTEGNQYKVQVRARYNAGQFANDPWSGPWTESTITIVGPPTPTPEPTVEPTSEPTPETPEGTVTGLTLSSDAPGSLTIEWDTPSPSSSDYRIGWASVDQQYLSWSLPNEASRGNEYPDGNATSLTLTGLTGGAEFKVYMRARYMTGQYSNAPWSGPWTASVTQRVLDHATQATTTPQASTPQATTTSTPQVRHHDHTAGHNHAAGYKYATSHDHTAGHNHSGHNHFGECRRPSCPHWSDRVAPKLVQYGR